MIDINLSKDFFKNERIIRTFFSILGIMLFVYILLTIKIADIVAVFSALGTNILVLCFVVLLELIIRSLRFKFILRNVKDVPILDMFKIIFETTLFVIYSPGKVGEVMKLDLLKRHGIKRRDGFAAIIIDRVSDLSMVLLFSSAILFSFNLNLYPIVFLMLGGIGIGLMLYKLGVFKGMLMKLIKSFRQFTDWKTVVIICTLTPLLWLADAFIPYFALRCLGYDVNYQTIIPLYSASIIIGLISMIPGGLGSMDLSFSYILSNLAGVSNNHAIITIMVSRIAALSVCFLGSVLYFVEFRGAYNARRNVKQSENIVK